MESEHIRHCLLFCFQKKNDAHRIICETYGNVIERVRIDLNDLKNGDFDIIDKEYSGHPAIVKNELRKDGKKLKTMENASINLYCIDFFLL